jgi:hypothetical protein
MDKTICISVQQLQKLKCATQQKPNSSHIAEHIKNFVQLEGFKKISLSFAT